MPTITRSAPARSACADRGQRAQAAAVLDRHAGLARDPAQVVDRLRRARARAVEVDDVQEARARLDPRLRGGERVVVIDGLILGRTALPSFLAVPCWIAAPAQRTF